ncbi:uncharacterized protein LOC135983026 [Chrysemys picta bellii]|uniref:uncharacterized protein LOC135983026 n=1 Tax=Chrysemys picta bellii TaxID=8478 RepID=UPI0032B0FB9C
MNKLRCRMVSLTAIILSLDPGYWCAVLNLKDSYFHISIVPAHKCFLRFVVHHNHYQFTVLPFVLSAAPRVFIKCVAVIAAFLRRRQVQVFPYLDDWLVNLMRSTFNKLGLLLNVHKSTLSPTQRIDFIGGSVGLGSGQSLPDRDSFSDNARHHRRLQAVPHHHTKELLEAPRTYGSLYVHGTISKAEAQTSPGLAGVNLSARVQQPDKVVTLPLPVLGSLQWWLNPHAVCTGILFTKPQPFLSLVTDTSALGWGAHLEELRIQGLWSQVELLLLINIRELRVVRLACQTFHVHLRRHSVALMMDNTTTMFYINKHGGTRSFPLY